VWSPVALGSSVGLANTSLASPARIRWKWLEGTACYCIWSIIQSQYPTKLEIEIEWRSKSFNDAPNHWMTLQIIDWPSKPLDNAPNLSHWMTLLIIEFFVQSQSPISVFSLASFQRNVAKEISRTWSSIEIWDRKNDTSIAIHCRFFIENW